MERLPEPRGYRIVLTGQECDRLERMLADVADDEAEDAEEQECSG